MKNSGYGWIGNALIVAAFSIQAQTITIDGTKPGLVFDGIGAISGGGATSRLLPDYPEPQRSQILDYMFKPNYGASLHILKVEIGAGVNTTDGTEPSHQPERGVENYQKGYEWWLMEQAKLRNPAVKLYGLEWGAPGWIGSGNFWSQDNIDYLIRWIKHAKSDHGLTMDYMSGWNESGFNVNWYIQYRKSLDTAGLQNVQLVGGDDNGWAAAATVNTNSAFAKAVAVVGGHYPCGFLKYATTCKSSSDAQKTGKPTWASEDGAQGPTTGAGSKARELIREYLDAKITASINWALVWAAYPNMPFGPAGYLLADSPWTGHYEVGSSLWVIAHYTQFTQPGWKYIDAASGYFDNTNHNLGGFVTLKSPATSDWTFIAETIGAASDRTVNFSVTGGLLTGSVHVWASNLSTSNPADCFIKQADIVPSGGSFSITLKKGYMYTLSTTTGQSKGAAPASPAPHAFPFPYGDNFESYAGSAKTARYFTDWDGTFETAPCMGGRSGTCLQQIVSSKGIPWSRGTFHPMTLLGDASWADYQIGTSVLFNQATFVQVFGRLASLAKATSNPSIWSMGGYFLEVSSDGRWAIKLGSTASTAQTNLVSGTVAGFDASKWHRLKIVFKGSAIEGWVDGTKVGSVTDGTFRTGMGGIGNSAWAKTEYDNYYVTTPGASEADTAKMVAIEARSPMEGSATFRSAILKDGRLFLAMKTARSTDVVRIRSVNGAVVFQHALGGSSGETPLELGPAAREKGLLIVEWTREGRILGTREIVNF